MTIDEKRSLMKTYFKEQNFSKIFQIGEEVAKSPDAEPFDLLVFANSCMFVRKYHEAYKWFIALNRHPDADDINKKAASAAIHALQRFMFPK